MEETTLENLDIYGRIILKLILKKQGGRVKTSGNAQVWLVVRHQTNKTGEI
jgi:hypothetical protein